MAQPSTEIAMVALSEDAGNWLSLLKDIVVAADANDGGSLMNCIEAARDAITKAEEVK